MEKKQKNNQNRKNKIALKGGIYSLLVTGIVLAILVAVNVFVSILPSNLTKYDMSSTKQYKGGCQFVKKRYQDLLGCTGGQRR